MKRKNEEVNILGDENLAQAILRISNDVLDVLVGAPTKRKHEEKPKHGMELGNASGAPTYADMQRLQRERYGAIYGGTFPSGVETTGRMIVRAFDSGAVPFGNSAQRWAGWSTSTDNLIPFDPLDHEQESQ